MHPVERAKELIREIEEKEQQHAEWRASRVGEPDAMEAWAALRHPPEPKWFRDMEQRRAENAAKEEIERNAKAAPKKFDYLKRVVVRIGFKE